MKGASHSTGGEFTSRLFHWNQDLPGSDAQGWDLSRIAEISLPVWYKIRCLGYNYKDNKHSIIYRTIQILGNYLLMFLHTNSTTVDYLGNSPWVSKTPIVHYKPLFPAILRVCNKIRMWKATLLNCAYTKMTGFDIKARLWIAPTTHYRNGSKLQAWLFMPKNNYE